MSMRTAPNHRRKLTSGQPALRPLLSLQSLCFCPSLNCRLRGPDRICVDLFTRYLEKNATKTAAQPFAFVSPGMKLIITFTYLSVAHHMANGQGTFSAVSVRWVINLKVNWLGFYETLKLNKSWEMPKMSGFHQKNSTSRLQGLCNYICKALTEIQLVKYKHQESYTFGSLQVFY